jgi:tetratricopeptide (TPR) repeat protein
MSSPIHLLAKNVKPQAIRCISLDDGSSVTFKNSRNHFYVAGMILEIEPKKEWIFNKTKFITGEVLSTRIDIPALNLEPLILNDFGTWDPNDVYWREEEDPMEPYESEILKFGARESFEMEQVLPLSDPDDFDSDPIIEAVELKHIGEHRKAHQLLSSVLEEDLRCIDAHNSLGVMSFDIFPQVALSHYEIGVAIGRQAIEGKEKPVLLWGCLGNRPFLRCLHGYGLTLWKLERHKEAFEIFMEALWFNPLDNQGIRCLIDDVQSGKEYSSDKYE